MSSLRKIEANRENGKLGGPKTPEGKAAAALNSIKHGLAGNTLVLTNESRPMYNKILEDYSERFQPADGVEVDVLNEVVSCRWRLQRIWAMETAMIDLEMDDQEEAVAKDRGDIDEVVRMAMAFKSLADGKGLTVLHRYESRIRRQCDRSLAELRTLQAERKSQEPNQPLPPAAPEIKKCRTNPPSPPEPPSTTSPITEKTIVITREPAAPPSGDLKKPDAGA